MDKSSVLDKLVSLKKKSGNHSPSLSEIQAIVGKDPVEIDACFLSNPYATKLIYESGIIDEINDNFFKLVESYPPNQDYILKKISKIEGVSVENSIALSGAQACIEVLLSNLKYSNCLLPIPTYSSYHESLRYDTKVHYLELKEVNNFRINEAELYESITENDIDLLVLINPNNPTGVGVDPKLFGNLLNKFKDLQIIIDESFSHFFYDLNEWRTFRKALLNNERCYLLKSMSKDFGIAGCRIGFMESSNPIMQDIKSRYGTWALSNMAVMLLEVMSTDVFLKNYEKARTTYLSEKKSFHNELMKIQSIKVYESDSNFFLIKVLNSVDSGFKFVMDLLLKTGLYVRSMDDKLGLDSSYIRVACRSKDENREIIKILKSNV
jgi:histidinol-phosphate/aromatic aminotransferase/cobyric acid decarboxylase-like protein